MASTSALKLHVAFSDPSSSASHPLQTPPRNEWPLPSSSANQAGDDGWDLTDQEQEEDEAIQGRRWLTAMESWQTPHDQSDETSNSTRVSSTSLLRHRGSVSSLRSNRSRRLPDLDEDIDPPQDSSATQHRSRSHLGGSAGARIAIGTADGSIWIFAQCPSKNSTTPTISAPSPEPPSPETNRNRAPSPSPSMASQSSRSTRHGHGRESISLPPFAGFASSQHAQPEITLSPSSPSSGHTTEPTTVSNISSNDWKASSSPSSAQSPGSSSLESRLEAQYHTGANRESALGGMMEALGLSKHHHQHHSHHASPSQSTSRSTNVSGHATPAEHTSAAKPKSNPVSASMGPPKGRRQAHSRTTAITTDFFSSTSTGEQGPIPAASSQTGSTQSSAEASRRQSVAASVQGDETAAGMSAEHRIAALEAIEPIIHLRMRENSPVVSMQSLRPSSEPEQIFLVLQKSGLLSVWSLVDGTLLSELHLANSQNLIPRKATPPETVPTPGASNSALAGLSTPIAALAALRSHTNSPALSIGSKGGHAGGADTPRREREVPVEEERDAYSIAASYQWMQTWSTEETNKSSSAFAACYDSAKHRIVFLELKRTAIPRSWKLQTLKVVSIPADVFQPSVQSGADHSHGGTTAQIVGLRENNTSLWVQDVALETQTHSVKGVPTPAAASSPALRSTPQTMALLPGAVNAKYAGIVSVWLDVVLVWSEQGLAVLRLSNDGVSELASVELSEIQEVRLQTSPNANTEWAIVRTQQDTQLLEIMSNDEHTNVAQALTPTGNKESWTQSVTSTASHQASSAPETIVVRVAGGLTTIWTSKIQSDANETLDTLLWTIPPEAPRSKEGHEAFLPLSMEKIIAVAKGGSLNYSSLSQLVSRDLPKQQLNNSARTQAALTHLTMLTNPRSQAKIVFGGYSSGHVAFWDSATLHLIAQWSLLTVPIVGAYTFGQNDNTLRLNGCAVVVGQDGTVAIVLLDGLKLLSLIPGRGIPLERIAVRADDILLLYGDERARVWDMASQGLRRSIGLDQALALLDDGSGTWTQHELIGQSDMAQASSVGVLSSILPRYDSPACMLADFRKAIDAAAKAVDGSNQSRSGTLRAPTDISLAPSSSGQSDASSNTLPLPRPKTSRPMSPMGPARALSILKPVLSMVWPWGLQEDKDNLLCSVLQTKRPRSSISSGIAQEGHQLVVCPGAESTQRLSFSAAANITASRLLVILSMLQVLTRIDNISRSITELMDWTLKALPEAIGSMYQHPSLEILARHLVDPSQDVQTACRSLFANEARHLSSRESEMLCATWSAYLSNSNAQITVPTNLAVENTPKEHAAHATALLGFMALENYTSMDPATLKEVAKRILVLIEDNLHAHGQMVGLHLCLEGFSIWQQYIDAMQLLRLVSTLAMSQEEASMGGASSRQRQAVIDLARRTTLRIAEENTPLFITTLHLDILQASSAKAAASTMRLVAFIVRRQPLILYANLPRLAEALVKSLDPTSPMRETVLESATMMISELIQTYPSISFHNKLQRLAIGTHEGAAILYDLKTATRLFIIEGHQSKIDGLSFSPDGRRLITVSLIEGKILIWKVGSSFTGFFNPGIMPKQNGSDPSGAYKSVAFVPPPPSRHTAETGKSSIYQELHEDELPRIDIQWNGDKDVQVDIATASMAFNTT
ncbi:unnamed protein product [Sympodiomycopsis kandeliae]